MGIKIYNIPAKITFFVNYRDTGEVILLKYYKQALFKQLSFSEIMRIPYE